MNWSKMDTFEFIYKRWNKLEVHMPKNHQRLLQIYLTGENTNRVPRWYKTRNHCYIRQPENTINRHKFSVKCFTKYRGTTTHKQNVTAFEELKLKVKLKVFFQIETDQNKTQNQTKVKCIKHTNVHCYMWCQIYYQCQI